MTNANNNAHNVQSAAENAITECELSRWNRSYIVGTTTNHTQLLIFETHGVMVSELNMPGVRGKYVLLDPLPVETVNGCVNLSDGYIPLGSNQILSGVSSKNERYVFVCSHMIEKDQDAVLGDVNYARPENTEQERAMLWCARHDADMMTQGPMIGADPRGLDPEEIDPDNMWDFLILGWKYSICYGFVPLSGRLTASDENIKLAAKVLAETIDAKKASLQRL